MENRSDFLNRDYVTKVINLWDPIDLLLHAPKDEYEVEIILIMGLMEKISDVDEFARGIQKIFLDEFGDDVFKRDYQECLQVAKKLLVVR